MKNNNSCNCWLYDLPRDAESIESSHEMVIEATNILLNNDPSLSFADPLLPCYQFFGLCLLDELEKSYKEKNKKKTILKAIAVCANYGLKMPEWVSQTFLDSYYSVIRGEKMSWDEAFGMPFRNGAHKKTIKNSRKKIPVFYAVREANKNIPIPKVFEVVGEQFGIGERLAKDYYYEIKKIFDKNKRGLIFSVNS